MVKDATLIPIGELLTKSDILSIDDLQSCLDRAKERGLPIGKVMVMLGHIKQRELKAAVEAQSLINDGMLSSDLAAKALQLVAKQDMKLPEALGQLGWKKQKAGATNRIGELLVEAEAITWEQLDEALRTSIETGLPVGRVLVFRKAITNAILLACLTAQKLIREGVISREQAVQGLKAVRQRAISFEESLAASGFYKPPSRRSTPLGYILVEAGLLEETQLMTCMEIALTDEKPIGEVFIEQKLLSRALLKAALKVQEMVDNTTIATSVAAASLKKIHAEGCSVVKAVAESCCPQLQPHHKNLLIEMLSLAQLADPAEIQQITGPESTADEFKKELLLSGLVSESLMYALLRSLYLIDTKILVQEDAIMAIHHCRKSNSSLDEALKDLGWTAPMRKR
ncbi:MAG: hypothetical protein K2W95_27950 [Candidatus Obscuribacterales bacterium]|nr:hypothetical protein [Candidatus Obscuribacterales bacterium]